MLSYIWPMALIVLSNVLYQICAKGVPEKSGPFAALTVTYLVGAALSAVLHCVLYPKQSLFSDIAHLNWAPYLLGLVIVGLEAGWIFAYKAGWQVSTAPLIQSVFLTVALLFVGLFLYRETLTWNKLVGMAVCFAGLFLIAMK